jgi:alpha-1,2-mannosyltransferase
MDSLSPLLKKHWPLALAALAFGLYGWALVVATGSGHDGVIGPRFNALGADWVIFLAAARAFFTGDLGHVYNQAWITTSTNSQFGHWLSAPLPFPLFPYPPVFLLLVLPFALLPVVWSLFLSQLLQFAALALALRRLGGSYLFFLVGVLLAPAASNNVLAGSNSVLVAALIVGGVTLLETRPLLAGALLGVVIFKPQFFVLLPFVLVAARQTRALAGAIGCAVIFTLLSVVMFGPALWLDWINVYLHPQALVGVNATEWGHRWDDSVSTCASLLGAPPGLALAAQVLAGMAALWVSWRVFRDRHPQRLAILLCAVLLPSPHVSNYDLILPAIAALLLVRAMPESSRPLVLVLPLAAWIAPLYNPPRVMPAGLVTPLVLLGLIWVLFREKRSQKPLPAKG